MKSKMPFHWVGLMTAFCLAVHIRVVQPDENIKCYYLKTVFSNCLCRAATEEKGAVHAIVDCSSQQLTEVPTMNGSYDQEIYKLVLRNNSITQLQNSSFQGLKIEYLDLSGNQLVSIESGTFLSMKESLKTLEIEGNSQVGPPTDALKSLHNLQSLTMRNYNVPSMENKIFLPFTNLESLTLDRWTTSHIEGSSFIGPRALLSLALLNLELEYLPLEALRQDPFSHLETLQISSTAIKTVSHSAFSRLDSLKTLDLSNNKINDLEENCFLGVDDTLESINLHGNLLNNDDQNKLAGLQNLKSLKHLDLSKNTFMQIPKIQNLGTTQPLRLLLNDNEISQLQDNAFSGYAQYLQSLDLTKNYLRNTGSNSFFGVSQLQQLHFSNQLGASSAAVQLPSSLIYSATTLQNIDLSGQKVDVTSLWSVIKQLTSLQQLNLQSVELKHIPDLIFQNVTALEKLHLGFNSLSKVNQKSFLGLRQLDTLDLVSNNIQTIPSCLFHGFQSAKIALKLFNNPIKCDCGIKKFLEDVQSGLIELDPTSVCIGDNQPLASKDPATVCSSPTVEQPCIDSYYTTSTPGTSGPVTLPPQPEIDITILGEGTDSINATWTISDATYVDTFTFHVTSTADDSRLFTKDEITKTERRIQATNLPEDTRVEACVTVYFSNNLKQTTSCASGKTKSSEDPNKSNLDDDSDSANTGIIVGCVVAGVAFVGVMAAIIILMLFRKKPKKVPDNNVPITQPRNFAKAELPSMTEDSRSFKKPPKKGMSPEHKGMQVVAISDGQTSPGARVGRANMMFQEDGYEPMNNFTKMNGDSVYENDRGALPPTPGQDSRPPSYPGGYYNQGFSKDKYDQIEVEL